MPRPPSKLSSLLARLDVSLPSGELVDGQGSPVLWVSSGQPRAGLWSRLRAVHAASGLWPVLVSWTDVFGHVPVGASPDQYIADVVLARAWQEHLPDDDSEHFAAILADMQPFGVTWPGASVRPPMVEDPGSAADSFAESLLHRKRRLRLGLVAAARAADVIAVLGWTGAANYRLDNSEIAAVLRDWEDRFGAQVVSFGGIASLDLSVAAPPQSISDARRVAAEHLAFCPDNLTGSLTDTSLQAYAERLIGVRSWSFWWD
jgi:hypothetical protein